MSCEQRSIELAGLVGSYYAKEKDMHYLPSNKNLLTKYIAPIYM